MYVKLFEDGVEARDIMQKYIDSTEEVARLKKQLANTKAHMERELAKARRNIQMVCKQLKDQQANVVKPLLIELKIKDEIAERYRKIHDQDSGDLRKLTAVLRLPAMSTAFQKAIRRYHKE